MTTPELAFEIIERATLEGAEGGPWYGVRFSDGEEVGWWRNRISAVYLGEKTCADGLDRINLWRELQRVRARVVELEGERAQQASAVDEYLTNEWRALRDDASESPMRYYGGAVDALHAAGVLTKEQRELWARRAETCPGHDDEGGRSWCSFCGDMPKEATR